jgi:hypothetical protein
LFKCGIERDFNAFPTLKDERNNDQWHHTFTNIARAQDLSDVLNPKYVPLTTAAYDLFWEKQKFLYAILEAKVETAKGSPSYASTKVCMMLRKHMRNSNNITLCPTVPCLLPIRLWNTSRPYA